MSKYWAPPPWFSPYFYGNQQQPQMPIQPIPQTKDELVKFLKKEIKALKEKKPEEKKKEEDKKRTFTYWQTAWICLSCAIPAGMFEIFLVKGLGAAFLQALRLP